MVGTQGGSLRRSLGLGSLTFYGVGLILGAGIYSILGEAAGIAGEALWLSFLLGGLAALLTGLSYAELLHRGYTRCTVTPERWAAEYVIVADVTDPDSTTSVDATATIDAGTVAVTMS